MPLYDIQCTHCEGIFDKLLPVKALGNELICPYCEKPTLAVPMITMGSVALEVVEEWKPQSKAEELTGPGVHGPGTRKSAMKSSVLHNCKGFNCSICK